MNDFQVWASLGIKGNAIEQMAKFSSLTIKAYANIEKLERALGVISPSINKLARQFQALNVTSTESTSIMARLSKTLTIATDRTNVLAASTARLARNLEVVAAKGMIASKAVGAGGIGGGIGAASGLGGMAMGVAAGVGYLGYAGFEKQKEFQQQVQQLRGSGLTDAQIQEAQKIAYTPTKGISSIGKISALNDAFMASRDWKEAKILAPMLAEAQFAGSATFHNMTDQQRQFMVRFAEMRAGSDMSKIPAGMDLAYRMMNASAGTLDPRQQTQFMKQAASVAYHLTDRGFAGLEPVLQEIGGSRAGTAYQTGYQMMATGTGTLNNQKRINDLINLGIYKGGKKDRNGRFVSTTMDPALLSLYESDPVAFVKKITSVYAQHGTTSTDDINRRFALDFPRLTAQLFSLIMKNSAKINRELGLFDRQPGIDSSFKKALNIPTGASERLSNAWSSMTTSFGKLSSPAVIGGMNLLSSFLEKLTNLFSEMQTDVGRGHLLHKGIAANNAITNPLGYLVNKTTDFFVSHGNKSQPVVVHNTIQLDSKPIAHQVIKHQARAMNAGGTLSGTSNVNPGVSIPPTAYNNAGRP